MKQYILTKGTIMSLLEEAFVAGYESPLELANQEIEKIFANKLSKIVTEAKAPAAPKKKLPSNQTQYNYQNAVDMNKIMSKEAVLKWMEGIEKRIDDEFL